MKIQSQPILLVIMILLVATGSFFGQSTTFIERYQARVSVT